MDERRRVIGGREWIMLVCVGDGLRFPPILTLDPWQQANSTMGEQSGEAAERHQRPCMVMEATVWEE